MHGVLRAPIGHKNSGQILKPEKYQLSIYSKELKYNLIRDGRSSILCRNLKMDRVKRTESELSFNRALTWLLKIKSLRLNKLV